MTDAEWGTVTTRLISVWPKHGWPESTLAVWRMEIEDAHCDAEDTFTAVRALSIAEGRAPALADVIKGAKTARAARRAAARRITDQQAEVYEALPDGVVAIIQSANYQDVAVVTPSEAEAVERGSARIPDLPDDIVVTNILGARSLVPRRYWPQGLDA